MGRFTSRNISRPLALMLAVGLAAVLAAGLGGPGAKGRHTIALIQLIENHAGTEISFYERDFFKKLRTFDNIRLKEGAEARELLSAGAGHVPQVYWYNNASRGDARSFKELQGRGLDYVVIYALTVQDRSFNIDVYVVDVGKPAITTFKDVAYLTSGDRRSLAGFHIVYLNVKERFYAYARKVFS